jgi:hypothetical protein
MWGIMRHERSAWVVIMVAVIVFTGLLNDAQCAEWKYLGSGVESKNISEVGFYDTQSVEYKPDGNVRSWTKFITESEVNRILKNNENIIIEAAGKKLATGYLPPYVLAFPDTNHDSHIAILSLEEVANIYETNTKSVVFYEMKCKEKQIRILSTTSYKKPDRPVSSNSPSEWMYIIPETRGDNLRKILCK